MNFDALRDQRLAARSRKAGFIGLTLFEGFLSLAVLISLVLFGVSYLQNPVQVKLIFDSGRTIQIPAQLLAACFLLAFYGMANLKFSIGRVHRSLRWASAQ
jgi:hypothetical protein